MKLTKSQLREIIKEELETTILNENDKIQQRVNIIKALPIANQPLTIETYIAAMDAAFPAPVTARGIKQQQEQAAKWVKGNPNDKIKDVAELMVKWAMRGRR